MRRPSRRFGFAKLAYGSAGIAADAERRQLVLRIVAGDDVEHPRGVLHRAADRADARVQARADHAVAADQLLRRRQADDAVDRGRVHGSTRRSPRRSRRSPGWRATDDAGAAARHARARVRCRTDCRTCRRTSCARRRRAFARFALARMIAPASRRRLTKVASSGGRSFAYARPRPTSCACRRCRTGP